MDRIQFNPKLGGCPKSDHAKMLVFFVFTMFSEVGGSWGGVCPHIFTYIHTPKDYGPKFRYPHTGTPNCGNSHVLLSMESHHPRMTPTYL